MSQRRTLLVLVVLLAAASAWAGRTLSEPKGITKQAGAANAKDVAAALKAAGLEKSCDRNALKSREIGGLACRLAVYSRVANRGAVKSEKDVRARADVAKDGLAAAKTVADYKPLARKPGLAENRFFAHREACGAVLTAYDAIAAADATADDATKKAIAEIVGTEKQGLFKDACVCAQKTIALATAANRSVDERGQLQGELTKRGCFLNREAVKSQRASGPSNDFSGAAGEVAASNTVAARLLDYASARDIDFNRCRDKHVDGTRITAPRKLERCACGEVGRWRFPKERGRPNIEIDVPVVKGQAKLKLKVNAPGKVVDCGPLAGPGVK